MVLLSENSKNKYNSMNKNVYECDTFAIVYKPVYIDIHNELDAFVKYQIQSKGKRGQTSILLHTIWSWTKKLYWNEAGSSRD